MEKYCKVSGCRFTSSHTTSGHKCGNCGVFGHGILECVNNSHDNLRKLNEKHGGDILQKSKRCTVKNCSTFWNHTTEAHHCNKCGTRTKNSECCLGPIKVDCPICKTPNTIRKRNMNIKGLDVKCCVCYDNNVDIFFESCKHINTCLECCKVIDSNYDNQKFDINTLNGKVINESDCTVPINFIEIKDKLVNYNNKIYIIIPAGMGCCIYAKRDNKDENFKLFFMHSDSWGQYGINTDDRPFLNLFKESYQEVKNY
jgi:hypothetical protein